MANPDLKDYSDPMFMFIVLSAIVIYPTLRIISGILSRRTGYPVSRIMKMPSFSVMKNEPKLAAASHKAYGITLCIWTILAIPMLGYLASGL